jgi:hypothetical protein
VASVGLLPLVVAGLACFVSSLRRLLRDDRWFPLGAMISSQNGSWLVVGLKKEACLSIGIKGTLLSSV